MLKKLETVDSVNQRLLEDEEQWGLESLGLMNSSVWREDPRRLVITLARYKFVSKMLSGMDRVAEIGCGDGFGARIVRQEVGELLITDVDPIFIEQFSKISSPRWPIEAQVNNILEKPLSKRVDAIYSLDVMEHISLAEEEIYLKNICLSLNEVGIAIIGMPSLESQVYASPVSKDGQVNCKSGQDLRGVLREYFQYVFMFSMNDELVHTGFFPMAHYLIGICCTPR